MANSKRRRARARERISSITENCEGASSGMGISISARPLASASTSAAASAGVSEESARIVACGDGRNSLKPSTS